MRFNFINAKVGKDIRMLVFYAFGWNLRIWMKFGAEMDYSLYYMELYMRLK